MMDGVFDLLFHQSLSKVPAAAAVVPPPVVSSHADEEDDEMARAIALSMTQNTPTSSASTSSSGHAAAAATAAAAAKDTKDIDDEAARQMQEWDEEMVPVPVNEDMLQQLLSMDIPDVRARKGLVHGGNVDGALTWISANQDSPDIDQVHT